MSPLISQQVLSPIGGVSQQSDKQRASSQMESQLNCFDSIVYGKIKRPPTTHVAQLANTTWSTPYLHAVNRDSMTKYHVVIENGNCFVFDGITGAKYPVLTPQGTSYLTLGTPQTEIIFQNDTFAGTSGSTLASTTHPYVGSTGATWSVIVGKNSLNGGTYGDTFTFGGPADPLLPGATGGGYVYSVNPGVADYTVELEVQVEAGSATTSGTRVWSRMIQPPDNSSFPVGYFVEVPQISTMDGSTIGLTINRQDANGTVTPLATYLGITGTSWTNGVEHTVGITTSGTTLSLVVDGVSETTAIDATYSQPGVVAIDGYDSSGGQYINYANFILDYAQTAPAQIQDGFRFCTVQDTTFIVNQTKTVEPLRSSFSPVRLPEALITVALADYGTNYYVTINNTTVGFQTGAPSAPGSRQQLGTDQITQQIFAALEASTLNNNFNFTLLGQIGTVEGASTIYVTNKFGFDFTISANDGLSDQGIQVVKGTVQAIADLPARALNGMVVEVQPDPENKIDTAYYVYDNLGSINLQGVWREAAAPGILTALDPKTMPWQLGPGPG